MYIKQRRSYTRYNIINELASQLKKELQMLLDNNLAEMAYQDHLESSAGYEWDPEDEDYLAWQAENDDIKARIKMLAEMELATEDGHSNITA
jgi:hypothetical protein